MASLPCPKTFKSEAFDIVRQQYTVLEFIDLIDYDLDPEQLAAKLAEYASYEFDSDDRLVILHHDNDYYTSVDAVGNLVYNFFRLCANFDIALDNILILTNHYGIDTEIKTVAAHICNSSAVSVVYTAHWFDFPSFDDLDQALQLKSDQAPTHLYTCLNGQERMHRLLTLCMLAEADLLEQGIISYHFG